MDRRPKERQTPPLEDKTALVTGAGGGIGRSVVKALLENGARVALADCSAPDLDGTLRDLGGAGVCLKVECDVSSPDSVRELIDLVAKNFGSVDILVNAAGVQRPIGPFVESPIRQWIRNVEVNLIGAAVCSRAVLPAMVSRKSGKIINFAGGGATGSRPNFSSYGAAKTAVVRFTEILADEVKDDNIQVNAVSPGVVRTRMIEEILQAGPDKAGDEFTKLKLKTGDEFDSPESAAELVCFLASEESDWISGKLISAVWDPWREWRDAPPAGMDKDLYVLRRIDLRNFRKSGQ